MSKPQTIAHLLSKPDSGAFEATINRSKQLLQLRQRLQNLLDEDLVSHCLLLNSRNGMLIMACDSTAWATRLRYHVPALLNGLRESGLESLQNIQIKVQPVTHTPVRSGNKASISSHGAYCLKQCANTIADPALRRALERLAEHHRADEP